MRLFHCGFAAVAMLCIFGGDVRAQAITIAGASCVPRETAVAQAKYQVSSGGIEFKTGQTGTLEFVCPVSITDNVYDFYLYFNNDDDGSATSDYYVEALLRRRNLTNGTNDSLCDFFSDSTGHGWNSCSGVTIDNDTYLYYVYIYVWRDTTQTNSIRFNGLKFVPSV